MKGRFFSIAVIFSLLAMLISLFMYFQSRNKDEKNIRLQQVLDVNELEQLGIQGDLEKMKEKSAALQEKLLAAESVSGGDFHYIIIGVICSLCIAAVFFYLYLAVLRPFDQMKDFAGKIAQGNFDVPLRYERSNYFGDFTWAFDSMRHEITKSRSCEREAIENNKTVIATLSHDIKTPIASIRAYAEGLEANMDCSMERREKYLSVIMKKCDEVARLTDDLFLHSISDLDKLKVDMEQIELRGLLEAAINEIAAERGDVRLFLPEKEVMVLADGNRIVQMCENVINNARKYAKTSIDVALEMRGEEARITFRDYGPGIPDEDMPFVYGKFYRGKNCGGEQGSGLGLYIVKYIVEKMEGSVLLCNRANGLEVAVTLPLSSGKA